MKVRAVLTSSLMGLLTSISAFAAPDWGQSQTVANMQIFPDTFSSTTFYYPPPPLVLALDEKGRPEVKLYSLLYSGQSWLGHSGLDVEVGQFTARFSRDPAHMQSLQRVRAALRYKTGSAVTLKPAPVRRLDASFRVPVQGEDGQTIHIQLSGRIMGDVTATTDEVTTINESVAETFQLTTHLKGQSLVILRNLFLKGNASASLDYAYIAARRNTEGDFVLSGDSVPIAVDLQRWPELSVIRDMAHVARAGYPILQVICDDFRKSNPGIEEKVVDIEAESVAGRRVAKTIIFTADPDAPTLVPVDFSYAVRVDRPYTYRTRTIDLDGEETISPWKSVEDWVRLLDITDRDYDPVQPRRSYEIEDNELLSEVNQ